MNEQLNHVMSILDFVKTNHNTIFVKIGGYDAVLDREYKGEVKFLNGRPFGDLIHVQRSSLSSECREFVHKSLLKRYNQGQFND